MEHTSSVYLRGYLNKTVSGVAFDGRGTSSCPGVFSYPFFVWALSPRKINFTSSDGGVSPRKMTPSFADPL